MPNFMLLVVTELFAKFTCTVSCILRTMLFMQFIFYIGKFICKPSSRKTSVLFIDFDPASMMLLRHIIICVKNLLAVSLVPSTSKFKI